MPYSNENEAKDVKEGAEVRKCGGAEVKSERRGDVEMCGGEESAEVRKCGSAEVKNSNPTAMRPHASASLNSPTSPLPHPPTSFNLHTSTPPHLRTSFSGLISLSAVALPDGGIESGRIPGQIILHTGVWRGGEVEITSEILEMMLENYVVLSDKSAAPYLEPYIKRDHSLSVNDIVGHWENLRVEDVEIPTTRGALKVTALLGDEVITNPEALEKIARGEWTRRSAEFVRRFNDEATGEEFEWVLLGSAYVDLPEITSIPPVRVPIAAAPTLEEAVVEMKKTSAEVWRCGGMEVKNGKPKHKEANISDSRNNSAEASGVEIMNLRRDCENLRRESAQRQEEVRRLRREGRLEELRRPGENGLALPEATVALIREGMEKFGGTERVMLRRGDREIEADIADFMVALAVELRDTGLVDTRVLTSAGARLDDDERKAERMARERGHIKAVAGSREKTEKDRVRGAGKDKKEICRTGDTKEWIPARNMRE